MTETERLIRETASYFAIGKIADIVGLTLPKFNPDAEYMLAIIEAQPLPDKIEVVAAPASDIRPVMGRPPTCERCNEEPAVFKSKFAMWLCNTCWKKATPEEKA